MRNGQSSGFWGMRKKPNDFFYSCGSSKLQLQLAKPALSHALRSPAPMGPDPNVGSMPFVVRHKCSDIRGN